MPNYSFVCKECKEQLDKYFSFEEEHYVECEKCNEPMEKELNATPIHFRGGGWGGNHGRG